MSEQTVGTNNGVQLFINTDLSRVFLWENRYANGNFNNATYDPLVMRAGTLLGRIEATQGLKICDTASSDGSQYPIGILAEDITIQEGDIKQVAMCIYGDVAEDKIILHNGQTLSSTVSVRSLRDWIQLMGIRIVPTTEMTDFDNA